MQEGSGYGGGGGEEGAAAAGGGGGYEFGVDPNLDPELALALRVSLEEERARQNQGAHFLLCSSEWGGMQSSRA